jgi:hypothetical protein
MRHETGQEASLVPVLLFSGLDHVVGHFCKQPGNTARTDRLQVAIGELPRHS